MSVVLPPNSTGSTVGTLTTGGKEYQQIQLVDATTVAQIQKVDSNGAASVTRNTDWSITHTPVAATQATISKGAVASTYHVCTSISFMVAVAGTAQTLIQVNLRDGATGAGTILWSMSILKTANEAPTFVTISGLSIIGSVNTAMTLEFSAAGVADSVQSVALTGYSKT